MDNIGGAEVVTLTLARELNADIYTTNISTEHIRSMGFEDVLPRVHSIGRIPIQAPFRQQMAFFRFSRLNLNKTLPIEQKYDFFIISGDWAMSGANHNSPNLWYVHSPLHELWAFKDHIRKTMITPWKRPLYDFWVWINRKLTLKYSKHVNHFVANSQNTKKRIALYYKNDSAVITVIHPPIDCKKYLLAVTAEDQKTKDQKSENYWLSVNRLAKHKRIEIQTRAFANLPEENLVIVGSYEKDSKHFETYRELIQNSATKNVHILNWVPEQELKELYAHCKGFITTSEAEDFGMTAVEAMASGKPVIAPAEGGYLETVIDGKTGKLIENIDTEKVMDSIREIGKEIEVDPHKYTQNSIDQAQKFDVSMFVEKIKTAINKTISKSNREIK